MDLKDDGSVRVNDEVRKVVKFLVEGVHHAWVKNDELRKEADNLRQNFRAHIERGIDRDLQLQELQDENRMLREIVDERDEEIRELRENVSELKAEQAKKKKRKRR